MVLGAIVVRDRIDDDGGAAPATGSGPLKLLCVPELTAVCDQLRTGDVAVTIEPATVSAERLRSVDAEDAAFDGWLTVGPWREAVDEARASSAEDLFANDTVLGRSPFVVAVWKDKRTALNCAEPLDLGCVGDAVNTRNFRLGVASDDDALGVLGDAALGVGHIDNPSFATNDLQETDLAEWLTGVDGRADRVGQNPGGRSFTELLTFGPANADGYLSTEADVGPQLAQASRRAEIDVMYVRPVVTADATFAGRTGKRGDRLRDLVVSDRVRAALAAAGWRVPGQPLATGVATTPRLGDDDGLPSGAVLSALIEIIR